MIQRYYLTPENIYKTGGNDQVLYTPIVVVRGSDLAHVYFSGRTARLPNGELSGKGDMRAQIRLVCENIKKSLDYVGANFQDIVRTVTYTTDIEEYYRCGDERFKHFTSPLPTSTLIGVNRLGMPEMLVEIEAEAIMEPERLRISE
jgi:enamine deaminase RidA (YjgF/YER057c/UK114 family)